MTKRINNNKKQSHFYGPHRRTTRVKLNITEKSITSPMVVTNEASYCLIIIYI